MRKYFKISGNFVGLGQELTFPDYMALVTNAMETSITSSEGTARNPLPNLFTITSSVASIDPFTGQFVNTSAETDFTDNFCVPGRFVYDSESRALSMYVNNSANTIDETYVGNCGSNNLQLVELFNFNDHDSIGDLRRDLQIIDQTLANLSQSIDNRFGVINTKIIDINSSVGSAILSVSRITRRVSTNEALIQKIQEDIENNAQDSTPTTPIAPVTPPSLELGSDTYEIGPIYGSVTQQEDLITSTGTTYDLLDVLGIDNKVCTLTGVRRVYRHYDLNITGTTVASHYWALGRVYYDSEGCISHRSPGYWATTDSNYTSNVTGHCEIGRATLYFSFKEIKIV